MINIQEKDFREILAEAARIGAETAFRRFVRYNYTQAARCLGITPKTLAKRVLEQKIVATDGLITGEAIDSYLSKNKNEN